MSAIAGYLGAADPSVLDRMLTAVAYRGDRSDTASVPGAEIGYRMWSGRPGKSAGAHRDGNTLAAALPALLTDPARLAALDGNFAAVRGVKRLLPGRLAVRAFSLGFGQYSIEKEQAKTVADSLGFPLTPVLRPRGQALHAGVPRAGGAAGAAAGAPGPVPPRRAGDRSSTASGRRGRSRSSRRC